MANIDDLNFGVHLDTKEFDEQVKATKQLADDLNLSLSQTLDLQKKVKPVKINLTDIKKQGELERQNIRTKGEQDRQNIRTEASQRRYNKSVSDGNKSLREANNLMQGRVGWLGQMQNQLLGATSIYAAQRVLREMVSITGEFEKQRMALRAIVQDVDGADALYSKLQGLALKSPFSFKELLSYGKQLSAFSVPLNELYDTTKMLADVSAGLGVSMDRIVLAYGQVRSAEFLRGTEVRQFTEAGIPILDELAKQFTELEGRAVSVGEVFDKISARQVPFEMVEKAFVDMTSAGGKFYQMQEVLAETLSGKISNLRDAYEKMNSEIGNSAEGFMKDAVDWVTRLMANYEEVGKTLVTLIGQYGLYRTILRFATADTFANAAANTMLGKALKGIWTVLSNNPYTTIAAALALLGTHLYKVVTQLSDYEKILKKVTDVEADYNADLSSQIIELDKLYTRLKMATKGTEEYEKARAEIQRQYNPYLEQIRAEKGDIEDLATAYGDLKAAIIAASQERFHEEATTEAQAEFANITGNIYKRFQQQIKKYGLEEDGKAQAELWQFVTGQAKRSQLSKRLQDIALHYYIGTDLKTHKSATPFSELRDEFRDAAKGYTDALDMADKVFANRAKKNNANDTSPATELTDLENKQDKKIKAIKREIDWIKKLQKAYGDLRESGLSDEDARRTMGEIFSIEQVSNNVDDWLEKFKGELREKEGLRLDAYRDSGGVWTIGYGHTKGVKAGDSISFEEAEKYLDEDIRAHSKWLIEQMKEGLALNQNQFLALFDYAYNAGVGNLKKLVAGKTVEEIGDALKTRGLRDKNGVIQPGLVKRVNARVALFNTTAEAQFAGSGLIATNFDEQIDVLIAKLRELGEKGQQAAEDISKGLGKDAVKGVASLLKDINSLEYALNNKIENDGDLSDTEADKKIAELSDIWRRLQSVNMQELSYLQETYNSEWFDNVLRLITSLNTRSLKDTVKKYYEEIREWTGEDFNLKGKGVNFDISKILSDYKNAVSKVGEKQLKVSTLLTGLTTDESSEKFKEIKAIFIQEFGADSWDKFWQDYLKNGTKAIEDLTNKEKESLKATAQEKLRDLAKRYVDEQTESLDLSDWGDKSIGQIVKIKNALKDLSKADLGLDDGLIKDLEKAGISLEDFEKTVKALLGKDLDNTNDELGKKLMGIANTAIDAIGGVIDKLKELDEITGGEFSGLIEGLEVTVDVVGATASGFASGGWVGAAVGFATSTLDAILDAIISAEQKKAELRAAEEELRLTFQELQRERTMDLFDTPFGDDQWGRYAKNLQTKLDKQKEIYSNYRKEIEGEIKAIDKILNSYFYGGGLLNYSDVGRVNKYDTLVAAKNDMQALLKSINIEVGDSSGKIADGFTQNLWDFVGEDGLLDTEVLQKWLDTYRERISAYEVERIEDIIENIDEYNEVVKEMVDFQESLFQDLASSIADNMIDAFLATGDAVSDLETVFQSLGRTILKSLLESFILNELLADAEKQFPALMSLFASEDASAQEKADALNDFVDGINDKAEENSELINELIKAFQDRNLLASDDDNEGLGNGIKSITEDTAQLLASYINAIRADVSVGKTQRAQMISLLQTIASQNVPNLSDYLNTVNAHLADIAQSNNAILANVQTIVSDLDSVMTNDGGIAFRVVQL